MAACETLLTYIRSILLQPRERGSVVLSVLLVLLIALLLLLVLL